MVVAGGPSGEPPAQALGDSLRGRVLGSSFEFMARIPRAPAAVGGSGGGAAGPVDVPLVLETMEGDDLEGSIVWDVSIALARLLMDGGAYPHKFFYPDRKFVELGAGCGLPGIVAALRGADVKLTDIASVLPRLRRNVHSNLHQLRERLPDAAEQLPFATQAAERAVVARLDWTTFGADVAAEQGGEGSDRDKPYSSLAVPHDVVLVTDCVYQECLVQPLVDTLLAVTAPGSIVLLTMRTRFSFQAAFLHKLRLSFSGRPLHFEERHLAGIVQPDDIIALRLRRRSPPSAPATGGVPVAGGQAAENS